MKNILRILNESKADKEAFEKKFGQGSLVRFQKLKDRFKNDGVKTDITWHTSHTEKDEMERLLLDMENKVVKDKNGKNRNNVIKVAENEYYTVYDILDWETSMNMGTGTGWCITGRYHTNGEVKPSQAEQYFNSYLSNGVISYLFCIPKDDGEKYCICIYNNGNFEFWTAADSSVGRGNYVEDPLPEFTYKGFTNKIFDIEDDTLVDYLGKRKVVPDIPKTVTEIYNFAFYHKQITSVTIPDSVTKISAGAFENNSLSTINIPDSVIEIGNDTFVNNKLMTVNLSNSLIKIGKRAFVGNKLGSVFIPDSVMEIGRNAFDYNVTIICNPDSYAETWAKENKYKYKAF